MTRLEREAGCGCRQWLKFRPWFDVRQPTRAGQSLILTRSGVAWSVAPPAREEKMWTRARNWRRLQYITLLLRRFAESTLRRLSPVKGAFVFPHERLQADVRARTCTKIVCLQIAILIRECRKSPRPPRRVRALYIYSRLT